MSDEIDNIVERQMQDRHEPPTDNKMLKLRNVLNIIFIICAVAGVVCMLTGKRDMGIYIVMVAMVFKFTEAAIRIMRR